jgi:REP element-mobilizing transposase RayT
MARIARQDLNSSVFSIKQNTDKRIFRNKNDREMFVDILKDTKEKYDFDIYGYCLLDDNAFWLVINSKQRNISAIMQSITISYARYRDDEKGLFIRRYKSEPLYSVKDVELTMEHLKRDVRYKDCPYCFYNPILNQPWPFIAKVDSNIEFLDGNRRGLSYRELEAIILNREGNRNDIIRFVYQNYNVTQKQLADFYGLTKSSISKILK